MERKTTIHNSKQQDNILPPLCKRPHESHQRGAGHDGHERLRPPAAVQRRVALFRQKVLGQQLYEAGKQQQAARYGVHDADHEQARLAHGVVEVVHEQANGLAQGRGAAVGQDHEPGLVGGAGEVDGGDAAAEGQALEALVEGDGDEKNDKGGARGDAEGHADEDAVEQDAGLQEHALQHEPLLLLGVGAVGRDTFALVLAVAGRGRGRVELVEVQGEVERPVVAVVAAGAIPAVLGARRLPIAVSHSMSMSMSISTAVAVAVDRRHGRRLWQGRRARHQALALALALALAGHDVQGNVVGPVARAAARSQAGPDRRRRAAGALARGPLVFVAVLGVDLLPHVRVRVRVAGAAGRQVRLEPDDANGKDHGDEAREGRVALAEKGREARVGEGDKGGRQQVHKGGGDEDAGAKVLRQEDDVGRAHAAGAPAEQGEAAREDADGEDQKEGEDVQTRLVVAALARAALGPRCIAVGTAAAAVAARELGTENLEVTMPSSESDVKEDRRQWATVDE
ncbi:hypothetical protein SPBR_03703 [Sporothrix brasiliensis 5110]|uniref:Uncharacterized protein n=1 Tax=Sporothrix brasiliensis 5110 TaxID=1398154 RepID=A0A0C2F7B8_9PEZI|nr:uncharacterized protein SPBR_03703 [Sporothrix brasiliensis 5110]KIH94859.1 hypothetical protein SPBR_03703 [Sporothrix brasiliensis 5110]